MHKFVYSDILQNHGDGISNFSRRSVSRKSPNCYFVHSKEPLPEEYEVHPYVGEAIALLSPLQLCTKVEPVLEDWEKTLYSSNMSDFWKSVYKSQ